MSGLVYVKPTNFCNVGCDHCYLPEVVRADKFRMSMDTVRQLAAFMADMGRSMRGSPVHVIWHGGEPLTIPPEWYFEAGAIFDEAVPGHTESMQTSLIPFKKEFAPLVHARFEGEIGSSVDFSQRKIKGSVENYHNLWIKKADLARSLGIFIVPGVVPTKDEVDSGDFMVSWFKDRDFPVFNIDRYNAYGGFDAMRPTNAEHSRFLISLFDACMAEMERSGSAPIVNVVTAAVRGVVTGVGGDRWGGSCMSQFAVVEPDGSLNNCPDKSTVEESFSKVADGFMAFAGSRLRRKWVRHQVIGHKKWHCGTCEYASWCKSGCPITPNGPDDGEQECSGYKSYLKHVSDFVSKCGLDLVDAYMNQNVAVPKISAYESMERDDG